MLNRSLPGVNCPAPLDEVADHRHGALGRVGDHGVPAIRKPLELDEMRRQRGCDISLALDRVDRIVFTTKHKGPALDAAKIREQVEGMALATRFCEPMQHL